LATIYEIGERAPPIEIWPVVVRRVAISADVEQNSLQPFRSAGQCAQERTASRTVCFSVSNRVSANVADGSVSTFHPLRRAAALHPLTDLRVQATKILGRKPGHDELIDLSYRP
jgi:hypothetical protein